MTSAEPHDTNTSRATLVTLVLGAVLVALVGAFALHAVATQAYSASFSAGRTVEERAASAATAGGLEPWNAQSTSRAKVMAGWLLGKQLLDSGDYNGAIVALDAAYRLDIGDAELLALYKKAQDVQALDTNRKAHLQHGHEGPGGTLTPGDLER
jgi:cytochrome c-type biogenesis protein CcmH/NrfG